MSTTDVLTGMATLFAGRTDAYFNGLPRPHAVRRRLTSKVWRQHLAGDGVELGTYPVTDRAVCRWGAIDLDDGDASLPAALAVQETWLDLGVVAHVEASRSKGFHVWVFASTWVPAAVMRHAGQYVNQISGACSPEVNPKNVAPWLVSGGLVNTVRTPYAGTRSPGRMAFYEGGAEVPLAEWLPFAMSTTAEPDVLAGIAGRWQQQQRRQKWEQWEQRLDSVPGGMPRIGGGQRQEAAEILAGRRRVAKGERDQQFHTMAQYLFARGVPEGEARRVIERVHTEQCDDPSSYPLGEAIDKIRRVYGGRQKL